MPHTLSTPTAEDPAQQFRLSPEQVEQFHQHGYLSPLTACSPEEMERLRPHIEQVLETDPPDHLSHRRGHNRHLDDRALYDLATCPEVLGPMISVVGDTLLLWRTNFFVKEPGAKEIPWHQDRNFWPIEPEMVISAWLAIDEAKVENSAVQVVPGTHRSLIPHKPAPESMEFPQMADTSVVDMEQKRDLEMKPGQFILFNERTMHHSEPNTSGKRRIGFAVRMILPMVRVLNYDASEHRIIVAHGEDNLGFNKLGPPPA